MDKAEFERRYDAVKARANGCWSAILLANGADLPMIKQRRNMPCPVCCQGTDCFQFTDKYGHGNYHCRKCKPGDGLQLLAALQKTDMGQALRMVERYLSLNPNLSATAPARSATVRQSQAVQRYWNAAKPIVEGDPADQYFKRRGISFRVYPNALRFHPALGYYEQNGERSVLKANYPGILAAIRNREGRCVNLQRYYLMDARLAPVASPRKLLYRLDGDAIRLGNPDKILGVAEGIENAMSILKEKKIPIWSAINAGNMANLWIPDHVEHLVIFGDNDANSMFTGEIASYTLARHFLSGGRKNPERTAEVHIPRVAGSDWNDEWMKKLTTGSNVTRLHAA